MSEGYEPKYYRLPTGPVRASGCGICAGCVGMGPCDDELATRDECGECALEAQHLPVPVPISAPTARAPVDALPVVGRVAWTTFSAARSATPVIARTAMRDW
jgi:hypothetical protein